MAEQDINILIERLDKILFWLKIAYLQDARKYFELILNSNRKKEVYQLTDGLNSISQIMRKTGIKSKRQIPDWWDEWTEKGILTESTQYKGRKTKVIDLKELGM